MAKYSVEFKLEVVKYYEENKCGYDTTEIYTHLYDKEVMNAMLQHPLSQFKMANAMEYCAA